MWIVKRTGNKKVLWSSVEGGLTHYKRSTWHLHIFLYVSTGKRIELPGNVALWFLYWSGSICATCGWHDWSISSCSALALLITLLNIATGEALLEAAVTSPEQWCTLAPPFKPFFWHYRIWMGHQWSHSVRTCRGAPGWPGTQPSTPVNGVRAAAHWAPWTLWPKRSETKMSLSTMCRSGLDKSRQWQSDWFDCSTERGHLPPRSTAPAGLHRALPSAHHLCLGLHWHSSSEQYLSSCSAHSSLCILLKLAIGVIITAVCF